MITGTIQKTVTGFILAGLAFEAGCSFLSPYTIHELPEGELDRLVSKYYKSDTESTLELLKSIYFQEGRSMEEAEYFFIVNIASAFTTAKYLVKASPKVMKYMHEKVIWYLEYIFSDYIKSDDPRVMMRNAMFYAYEAVISGNYV